MGAAYRRRGRGVLPLMSLVVVVVVAQLTRRASAQMSGPSPPHAPAIRRQSTTEEILIARGFRRQSTTEEMIRCRNFRYGRYARYATPSSCSCSVPEAEERNDSEPEEHAGAGAGAAGTEYLPHRSVQPPPSVRSQLVCA